MLPQLAGLATGATVVVLAVASVPHTAPRRMHPPAAPSDPGPRRRRGQPVVVAWMLGLTCAATIVGPGAAVVLAVGGVVRHRVHAARQQRARARALSDALPDLVDLLDLCVRAGLTLPLAHGLLAALAPTPVRRPLVEAAAAIELGQPRADALLAALTPLGDRPATVAHVLADHLRHGVPLEPALDRLSMELRLDRRRRAELDARRVPVRLLTPLILCILPAFAVLTVVPLLATSLRALPR